MLGKCEVCRRKRKVHRSDVSGKLVCPSCYIQARRQDSSLWEKCGRCGQRGYDDPSILASSGFAVKTPVKTAGQPVVAPAFKTLDYGTNSGQITATLKKVLGAKVYFLRYAAMTGGVP